MSASGGGLRKIGCMQAPTTETEAPTASKDPPGKTEAPTTSKDRPGTTEAPTTTTPNVHDEAPTTSITIPLYNHTYDYHQSRLN